MPITEYTTPGTGVDTTAPNPYSAPSPVENFRWDRSDGKLKWDKALDSEMSGGYYLIQYTDVATEPVEGDWLDFAGTTGRVTQGSISGTTGSYQDLTGSPGRKYRIKKVTSDANGAISSIWVGVDVEYEATTDRCYVMLYVKTLDLSVDDSFHLKVAMDVASTVQYVSYMNKTVIPVVSITAQVELESGMIIVPVIPTALVLNGATTVKYNFTLYGRGKVKQTWSSKTVPTASSAYLLDL